MKLAHYEPLSLSDFPGMLAATVFTVGCNFACPYCHNPELVRVSPETPYLAEETFFAFLERRRGKLTGVCITGGEPTLHPDLPKFIRHIHALGYAIKLDTNGSAPAVLTSLLQEQLLDYVAVDVKASAERYAEIAGDPRSYDAVRTSLDLLGRSPVAHEFRTTVLPALFSEEDIAGIAALLPDGSRYVLQNFIASKVLDAALAHARSFDADALRTIARHVQERFPHLQIETRTYI